MNIQILGAGAAAVIDLSQEPSKESMDKENHQSQLLLGYFCLILNCFASAGYVVCLFNYFLFFYFSFNVCFWISYI